MHHAVVSAFEGLVKDGMHPGYFLFLNVDPKSIDINIHPTKTEIKFDDEHSIYAMLRATVKHALGQFSIAPVLDFNKDSGFDTPYEYSKKTPVVPTIEVDRDFNPFQKEGKSTYKKQRDPSWESLYIGLKQEDVEIATGDAIEFESEEVTGSIFESEEQETSRTTFQLQNKYIISPIKSGIMVIHQHLAHQRILYEELLKNITVQEAVSQQLLFPLEISLSKPGVKIIKGVKEQLEHTGFVFSEIKNEGITINGIPSGIVESMVETILQQLIDDIKTEVPDAGFSQNDLLAKSLAKSMAVKTGTSLRTEEMEHLVHQLFACKEPAVSPENKPALITMDVSDFDKKFG